ncbi:MAG: LrgB family protein [Neobacillus sp.]|jgi:predicted murein hydrolase (TIGR00659 family)|nr:LrgB family protein [Neobacillus sp.]
MITLFSIVITITIYKLICFIGKRISSPLTNPVFLSTIAIIAILLMTKISYQDYTPAKDIMTYLLGPATVALAIPTYKNGKSLAKYFNAALLGLIAGTFITITSAILIAGWFDFPKEVLLSFSVKSVTVPVATEIGNIIEGNQSLIAGFVIVTGMTGALFGPQVLNLVRVDKPFARGLSIGTISHGIGTAEAVREGEVQGAVAGAAMGIAGILTSIVIPYVIPYLL